jgi:hypothetical protein
LFKEEEEEEDLNQDDTVPPSDDDDEQEDEEEEEEEEGSFLPLPALNFLRLRVLELFPADQPLWEGARAVWSKGPYFGPKSKNPSSYQVDYKWSLCMLLRRQKEPASGRPTSCTVKRFPLPEQPLFSGIRLDPQRALAMLDACDGYFQGNTGCLSLESDMIFYYSKESGKAVASAVHTDYTQDPVQKKKVPGAIATACLSFYSTIRVLPLDPMKIARAHQKRWTRKFPQVQFVFDPGPEDTDLNLQLLHEGRLFHHRGDGGGNEGITILIAPPGSGKTNSLVASGVPFEIIVSSRSLAQNLARRFGGMAFHVEKEGEMVRVRSQQDLEQEPKPLASVINSIHKLAQRPVERRPLFLDEITATLHRIGTLKQAGQSLLTHLIQLIHRVPSLVIASADITPELEGHFFTQFIDQPARPLRVLYKIYGRSAAETRCVELTRIKEAWAIYVRILRHNASHAPAEWVHLYRANVDQAQKLCQQQWPDGPTTFVHADTPLPPGFVETPSDTWKKYAIVCVSPTLKVGVSVVIPGHFSLILALGSTGCGPSDDFAQLYQRLRCPPLSLLHPDPRRRRRTKS